jgi:protoporphyrinogen oxidase
MDSRKSIAVIGGGILGLTLAYRFSRDGHRVTLYEKEESVGGLIRSIQVGGISMDRFYHVILAGDRNWISLINELGLGDRVYFTETRAGFLSAGKVYPMATISEYLRFPLLSLVDRIRLAVCLQWCKMQRNWRKLEKVSIQDFLISKGGRSLFEKFWKPLLKAKFDNVFENIPMTYIWSRVRRMASTRKPISQREVMGHIKGNLQIVIDTLKVRIEELGGQIRLGTTIERIQIEHDRASGVVVEGVFHHHDVVISTVPSPVHQRLLPENYRSKASEPTNYMGVVCILLLLRRRLSPYHTLNLVDDSIPYTAIIETTNVIDPEFMGGHHLVYIPKYLAPENKQWTKRSDKDLLEECIGHLTRMFPHFAREHIADYWIGREPFVEPVYRLNFFETIEPYIDRVQGLYIANNSHTYPFLLNCESVVRLAEQVVRKVYNDHA